MTQSVRDTVIRSLSAVGATQEAAFYADLFAAQDPERFALIVLDPRCLRKPLLDALTNNLQILANLKLTPIILVGALHSDPTNIKFHSQKLTKELDAVGVRAVKLNTRSYGLLDEVRKLCHASKMPILELTDGKSGLDLATICVAIKPAKVMFLQPSGGMTLGGKRVPVVNMSDLSKNSIFDPLTPGQETFTAQVKVLDELFGKDVKSLPSYVIASPLNLLSELFTTAGSGTMIRRSAHINEVSDLEGIDHGALRNSIEDAFGKQLKADFFEKDILKAYIAPHCKGGAILTERSGLTYLSKFWVMQSARGEGLARDVWDKVTSDNASFFWRSRIGNPFNDWYMRMCDGMQISGDWRVFWKGLSSQNITKAINFGTKTQADFIE
ncbi:MAG: hypothetical protein ACPGVT_06895 [Maricaulaceae bacterium]